MPFLNNDLDAVARLERYRNNIHRALNFSRFERLRSQKLKNWPFHIKFTRYESFRALKHSNWMVIFRIRNSQIRRALGICMTIIFVSKNNPKQAVYWSLFTPPKPRWKVSQPDKVFREVSSELSQLLFPVGGEYLVNTQIIHDSIHFSISYIPGI